MEQQQQATCIDDILIPSEMVELTRLRRNDGGAVVVRCEPVMEFGAMMDELRTLPGRPGLSESELEQAKAETREKFKEDPDALKRLMIPVVEAGTSFVRNDGTEQRPAFWFKAPVEGAIPGRVLGIVDLGNMFAAIMRLNGYSGGASDEVAFPPGGERGTDGGGDHGAGQGDGQAPERDLAFPQEGAG